MAANALGKFNIKYMPLSQTIKANIEQARRDRESNESGEENYINDGGASLDMVEAHFEANNEVMKTLIKYYSKENIPTLVHLNLTHEEFLLKLQQWTSLKKQYSEKDWLANKNEKGQTFKEWIVDQKRNKVTRNKNVIYIVCMDDDIPEYLLKKLSAYCKAFFYGMKVNIFKERVDIQTMLEDGKIKISNRIRRDTQKVQLLTTDLMDYIEKKFLPDNAYCTIGIVNKDLYPKDNWSFVFGCSRLRKRTGVFSFARYDPDFENPDHVPNYSEQSVLDECSKEQIEENPINKFNPTSNPLDGKSNTNTVFSSSRGEQRSRSKKKNSDSVFWRDPIDRKSEELQNLIVRRACKTMTHEIFHMFGAKHCIVHECLMNGTNRMEEGDLKPAILCPVCLRKLHHAIGFDMRDRYEEIMNVLETEFKDNLNFSNQYDSIKFFLDYFYTENLNSSITKTQIKKAIEENNDDGTTQEASKGGPVDDLEIIGGMRPLGMGTKKEKDQPPGVKRVKKADKNCCDCKCTIF